MRFIIQTLLPLLYLTLLPSCWDREGVSGNTDPDINNDILYTGLDINGRYKSCKQMHDKITCTEVYADEEKYIQDCEDKGNLAITCDCQEYICVSGESSGDATGFDIDGNERTCEPMALDTICTMVFTEGDQFALDCTEKEGTSFQCGCHDYVCLNLN